MQGHKHDDSGHRHWLPMKAYTPSNETNGHSTGSGSRKTTEVGYANIGLPTKYNDNYGNPRISRETRSKNTTVRLWKRIA